MEILVNGKRHLINSKVLVQSYLESLSESDANETLGERVDRQIEMYQIEIAEAQQQYDDYASEERDDIGDYICSLRDSLNFFMEDIEKDLDKYAF